MVTILSYELIVEKLSTHGIRIFFILKLVKNLRPISVISVFDRANYIAIYVITMFFLNLGRKWSELYSLGINGHERSLFTSCKLNLWDMNKQQ